VQALQDHETVINVIDTAVAGTEKFSEVAGMKRDGAEVTLGGNAFHARAPVTGNARSPSETGVWQEPRRRCWMPNALYDNTNIYKAHTVSIRAESEALNESRTRA